ncbi:hypothetical protein GIB67_022311, partial [Kingdonia uniflora]
VPPNTVEQCPPNTVKQSPPNTVETTNKGVSEHSGAYVEDGNEVQVTGGSQIQSEAAANNEEVGPIDTSLLRSFKFYRARSIALGQEKACLRVYHHPSTWDLTKEPQMVQDWVKLKESDVTIIGGTWGFPALLEVFEKNILLYLKGFKALKVGGIGNSLPLKKLRKHYAYKLENVLSDGTVVRAKNKGLTSRSVARAYMLYALGSFLFPTKRALMSGHGIWTCLPRTKRLRSGHGGQQFWRTCITISVQHLKMMGGNLHIVPPYSRGGSVTDRYGGPALLKFREALDKYKVDDAESCGLDRQIKALNNKLHKLKEDKDQESEANIKLAEALKEKEDMQLKRVLGEQCALVYADLPGQLDTKILECKNLQEKNVSLEAELRQKFGLEEYNVSLSIKMNKKSKENESLKVVNALLIEQIDLQLPPATPASLPTLLAILQSHQPMTDINLAKKYDDLLSAHEELKKKLIAKEDFCKKLVNAEEMKKSLKVNNNEWEIWRQSLKKALASEGMGNMGNPTFEELFDQNERFFTIAQ